MISALIDRQNDMCALIVWFAKSSNWTPTSESSVLTYLHSMPLKFYKSCADSLLLSLLISSFFSYFFHFSCLFFCVCSAVLCVNGERLRSQAKSHKTHSSNPQSHSSWVIYLTLSVMDKYYVAPNALDPALAEALQRQQQLQQKQMATDTTTVCVCVWGKKTQRG